RDYMLSESKDPIKNGDMVKFDFKGFVDDKPFAGGEAQDFNLEIGSGSFIPGFEEQMIGLKKGDKRSIEVTFPKDYHANDLAGKKARFDLDIKEVSNITRPVLDEAYLKKLNMPNVKTLDDLKKFYRNYIYEMKNQYANQKPKEQIREYLTDHAKLNFIPNTFVERQLGEIRAKHEEQAKQAKKDFEKYVQEDLKLKDIKVYEKEMKEQIEKNIKYSLAVSFLIKKLNIDITPAEVETEIKKVAAMYGMPADEMLKDQGMKERMAIYLTETKLFDKIIELNLKK
ncbi:MAG: trigger factor, partial [Clostridia bacterium]|nr:trigger factor [Clostridia bacterium]